MTDHKPGDLVGVFVDKLQIQVTTEHADQQHSYRTVSNRGKGRAETSTVTVESGFTYFRFRGDTFLFDGVQYRPESQYRDDEELTDGEVRLVYPDGIHPDTSHPLKGLSVSDFVDMVTSGELEPATNPDENVN